MSEAKNFVVFDTASGVVLRSGTCPTDMVSLQCGTGEDCIATDDIDAARAAETDIEPLKAALIEEGVAAPSMTSATTMGQIKTSINPV